MRILLLIVSLFLSAAAQEAPEAPKTVVVTVSPIRPGFKPPPVSLQQALQIAEKFIAEKNIAIERYWLREAKLVITPKEGRVSLWEGSHWVFMWDNLETAPGDCVHIEVGMTGQASRRPTM